MQLMSWTPEQSLALKDYVAAGLSFSQAADALNARFGTAYSRNAIIGRAKRMKLVVRARPERGPKFTPPKPRPLKAAVRKSREGRAGKAGPTAPSVERPAPVKLRCVGVRPRLVPFGELGDGECRYPYGGDRDGEAITFCGHPRFRNSSYCAPHFHLTRGPRIEAERPAERFALRLVEAA